MDDVYQEGQNSKAICEDCGLVVTTFKKRDVLFPESKITVKNILVAVCNKCNNTVGIPQQSVPAVKTALEGHNED